jgi:uncharacterized protein (DUF885 family)
MKTGKWKSYVFMTALLVSTQLAGCGSEAGSGETTPESQQMTENTTADEEQSVEDTESDQETTSSEEDDSEETTVEEETTTEEPTEPTDTNVSADTTEKYFQLMAMDLEEARDYYQVQENDTLTSEDFDSFLDELFVECVTSDRLTLDQYLKDASAYGIEDIGSITYDPGHLIYSDEEMETMSGMNEDELKEMLSYPYDSLDTRQQLIFDKMYYEYLIALWSGEVTDYTSQLGLTSGLIPNLAVTFYEYIFDTEDNVKTYARVMDYLPELILEIPEQVQKQIDELGYAPTDYMLDTALESIEELMEVEDNPFIDGYNAKIEALNLGKKVTKDYEEANEQFYKEEVIPALQEAYDQLEALYGTNPTGQGLCYYDGGLAYYEYLVEDAVGATASVDELMELLDDRLRSNMKKLIRYATFNSDAYEDYYYGNVSYPGDDDPETIINYFLEEMSGDFPAFPGSEWSVSNLPASLEIDGVLAYYLVPRIDASDVNIIRVNASATANDSTTLFMTLGHEGYPGHMLQFNIQQSCGAYAVEQIISHLGYSEGWAMYAEHKCMDYAGVSESMKNIILIDSDLNYDLCAYIDLAINGKGWSVDDVADYVDELGFDDSIADYLFDLCVGDPGALLPYSLGYIYTDQVIEDYVAESGASYQDAYEAFMSIGAAPFSVVKDYMGVEF